MAPTQVSEALLRARWDAGTQQLQLEYDDTPTNGVENWVKLASWNLTQGQTNWDLNASSTFAVSLSGDSEGAAVAVSEGMYLDTGSEIRRSPSSWSIMIATLTSALVCDAIRKMTS